ncbi:MAG: hypothetical protein ABI763_10515, partial [Bacteroidota bacterium]
PATHCAVGCKLFFIFYSIKGKDREKNKNVLARRGGLVESILLVAVISINQIASFEIRHAHFIL